MPLSEVVAANQEYLNSGQSLDRLAEGASRSVAIVTCMDGRLTGLVEPAMGFSRGEAVTIRVAGNTMAENDELLRSLAISVYSLGVKEVYVVGHTDCGATKIDTFNFTETMRRSGVRRDVVPSVSLRDWLGAFSDVADNVSRTCWRIKSSGMLPADVPVYGLVIDTATGELRVVEGRIDSGWTGSVDLTGLGKGGDGNV